MFQSDNSSFFAYNQTDYIDLETALAEEELASIGYGSHSDNDYTDNTFKLSFKNYDDRAVQRLRRSLVTPLSATSNNEDPMYRSLAKQPMNTAYYSPRVDNEPAWRTRINMSPTHSVADSLAYYNKIVDDTTEIDFVQSDLKDFMGSYTINDLMSRSDYSTPSPQNRHRYNQDAMVTRHEYLKEPSSLHASNINRNSPDFHSQVNKYSSEGRAPYRGSLLLELASKPTVSGQVGHTASNLNTAHKPSASKEILQNEHRVHDVPSTYRVVQKPVETSQKRLSTKQPRDVSKPVSSRYLQTRPVVDPTKQPRDISTIVSRYSQRRVSVRSEPTIMTKKQPNMPIVSSRYAQRRPSNDEATHTDLIKNQRLDVTAASRYVQRRPSNDKVKTLIDTPTVPRLDVTAVSRYAQRRPSTDKVKDGIDIPTVTRPDVAAASRYVQRRPSTDKVKTLIDTPTVTRLDVTAASRYVQRRPSTDKVKNGIDAPTVPRLDVTEASRYVQRRPSTDKVKNGIEIPHVPRLSVDKMESIIESPRTQRHDITVPKSRLVQRRASNERVEEPHEPIQPQRRDISTTSRYAKQLLSDYHVEQIKEPPKPQMRDISAITSRYSQRRLSTEIPEAMKVTHPRPRPVSIRIEPSNTSQRLCSSNGSISRKPSFRTSIGHAPVDTSSNSHVLSNVDKRASYHGGYGETSTVSVPQQPRRPRSFSVPSNECIDEHPIKNSLLPVLSTRIRKYSNPTYADKPETVPENEVVAPRSKEIRFAVDHHHTIHLSPSQSTDGCSNSTASSQSGDFDSGPATPPRYSHLEQSRHGKKFGTQTVEDVLEKVKQRRARTAAIINSMYK